MLTFAPGAPLTLTGGNAGLAAAQASQLLGVKCTVFAHTTTEQAIVETLRSLGTDVRLEPGWDECNAAAHAFVGSAPAAVYVHPFIGEDLVRGHASLCEEIMQQFPGVAREAGVAHAAGPDVLACSIGGGGMVQGLILGLTEHAARAQAPATHLLAVCLAGADSFTRSLETEDEFVTLEDAHSRAASLRCAACSPVAVQHARQFASTGSVVGAGPSTKGKAGRFLTVVRAPDDYAGAASWQYRRDDPEHALLELGCGAALIPAYQQGVLDFIARTKLCPDEPGRRLNVVIVACGGSRVSAEDVVGFERDYGLGGGPVFADGHEL